MFSIKEWNFEEYKAAVKEIEDPVDRHDELKARLGNCWIEWLNYDAEFEDEVFSQGEYENICLRFEIFKTWTEKEIKIHSDKFYSEIALREKSSWFEHVRLPFPVVWNRRTYNDFEPEVRRNGKKKEWIDWLLGNLVEGKEEYWTYEPWILNAFENEEIYEVYMDGRADFNMQSILVGSLTNDFVVFLLNVKQVLALKDASPNKKAITREPIEIERSELDNVILRTVKSRKSAGKSLHWNRVLRDLKNYIGEGQRIVLSDIPARDGTMKEGISFYVDGYESPVQTLLQSTFKKKLTKFRKLPLLE